jgi:ribosomal protein S24E
MEFEIIKEKENPLFKRKEIQISLEAQVTPSKNEMIDLIAKKFSTQSENISMKGIYGKFGSRNFTINANIYSSKEEKDEVESKKKNKEKNDSIAEENKSEEKNDESQGDSGDKQQTNVEESADSNSSQSSEASEIKSEEKVE